MLFVSLENVSSKNLTLLIEEIKIFLINHISSTIDKDTQEQIKENIHLKLQQYRQNKNFSFELVHWLMMNCVDSRKCRAITRFCNLLHKLNQEHKLSLPKDHIKKISNYASLLNDIFASDDLQISSYKEVFNHIEEISQLSAAKKKNYSFQCLKFYGNLNLTNIFKKENKLSAKDTGELFEKHFCDFLNKKFDKNPRLKEQRLSIQKYLNRIAKSPKKTDCVLVKPNQKIYKTDLQYKNNNNSLIRMSLKTVVKGAATIQNVVNLKFVDVLEERNCFKGFNKREKIKIKQILFLMIKEKSDLMKLLNQEKEIPYFKNFKFWGKSKKFKALIKNKNGFDLAYFLEHFNYEANLLLKFLNQSKPTLLNYLFKGCSLENLKEIVVNTRKNKKLHFYHLQDLLEDLNKQHFSYKENGLCLNDKMSFKTNGKGFRAFLHTTQCQSNFVVKNFEI